MVVNLRVSRRTLLRVLSSDSSSFGSVSWYCGSTIGDIHYGRSMCAKMGLCVYIDNFLPDDTNFCLTVDDIAEVSFHQLRRLAVA